MGKISRVRTGCWTCKRRRRKCDETKPACLNCINSGRECEGYDLRLSFCINSEPKKKSNKAAGVKTKASKDLKHSSKDSDLEVSLESSFSLADPFLMPDLDHEFMEFLDKTETLVNDLGDDPEAWRISYEEENMILRYFFKNLLPLLDGHPNSPWPHLALKYCEFEIARSCFISLACIHMYQSQNGDSSHYRMGLAHTNKTMDHLLSCIHSEEKSSDHVRYFVILVLINVHILSVVLQKGLSSQVRYFFSVFSSICQDESFFGTLEDDQKRSLVVVLSWYDTVSALVSPDCRLPYCLPQWYGDVNDSISTASMMGCPGEIFRTMAKICVLRHEHHHGELIRSSYDKSFATAEAELLDYRRYVSFDSGKDYTLRLKGAQCWALAVYIALLRIRPTEHNRARVQAAVHEFLDVYSTIPKDSPVATQMVWPILSVGCACQTEFEMASMTSIMNTLHETVQMGTLDSLRWIVSQVWQRGIPQEQVIREWAGQNDYLPL